MTRPGPLPALLATSLLALPAAAADTTAPTAVLDAPDTLGYGAALQLVGSRSTDVGGRIVRYTWTRLEGSGGGMPLNQPIVTDAASYLVPQSASSLLAVGKHRFRLVVTDDSGNQSSANDRYVVVVDNVAPTAVPSAPASAMQVQPFQLSASRSYDVGGKVVRYQWTRVSAGLGPMPTGQPVITDSAVYTVPQSLTSYLGVGRHLFRLAVVDDSGNVSSAVDVAVDVTAPAVGGR